MKRPPLYSARRPPAVEEPLAEAVGVPQASRTTRLKSWLRTPAALWAGMLLLAALLTLNLVRPLTPSAKPLTQKQFDAAVLHTLNTQVVPSQAARAADMVGPSVVRVMGYVTDKKTGETVEQGVGTGVVIVDKGVILTNLHVVQGAETIKVMFADGLEAEAFVTGMQAENDLAVLQAKEIPDDLHAATMRSTGDLVPGDQVVAIGFPYGIGPSVSAGVVSGLGRSFRSPEGKQVISNLIQFDAAANPGNSGGPLVTMDGHVVGIVTAILNPTNARTFVGIGFAVPIENAASAAGLPPF